MLKDDDEDEMLRKLEQASRDIERYKDEIIQKKLREYSDANQFAPGIQADYDPLEHMFSYGTQQEN